MLSARENLILRAIIQEYAGSAQPVGSRLLMTRYGLGISPATIRSVMSALTEAGYLRQPHTSAGRVPTERAYRLFLEGTESSAPSLGEQQKLSLRLDKAKTRADKSKVAARQLSELAGAAGFYVDRGGALVYNLSNVFGQPEFQDPRVAGYVAELIDQLTEWVPRLSPDDGNVAVRIGEENDDFRARQVSVMTMKAGDAYIGLIGQTRMPYRKLLALFNYVKDHQVKHHET